MKHIALFMCLLLKCGFLSAQSEIDLYEATLDLQQNSVQMFYYGFAEGDQILFNFETVKKKQTAQIEVSEYGSSVKLKDDEATKIQGKKLLVLKKGVYAFKFNNKNKRTCVCKIKIQRIPASENTRLFNSEIKWEIQQDTQWSSFTKEVLIGYDTLYEQKSKKELVKTELSEETLLDKSEKIHSVNNSNGNKASIFFTLPSGQTSDLVNKRLTSWAFWIGVGDEANKAWERNCKTISSLAGSLASTIITPLGGLLVGKMTELLIPSTGEDVAYGVVDENAKNRFYQNLEYKGYDFGKGVAGYKKFDGSNMLSGTWYIVMSNDNQIVPINANVKVVALFETKTYKHVNYTEMKVTPKYEKRIFKEPHINTKSVPVILN